MINQSEIMKLFKLYLIWVVIAVTGCTGGESASQPDVGTNNSSETTENSIDDQQNLVFDCFNLDQGKVYAIGTFQEAASYVDVLFDPEEPSNFCIGFSGHHKAGVISVSGKYYYGGYQEVIGDAVFTFNPDEMKVDDEVTDGYLLRSNDGEIWRYPRNSFENDDYLVSAGIACGIGSVYLQPNTDFKFYTCPTDTLHAEDLRAPFDLGNGSMISITPSGSAVVVQHTGLWIYDTPDSARQIDLPELVSHDYETWLAAKNYTDPSLMRHQLWFVVSVRNHVSGDIRLHRWMLDLDSEVVTDQGVYADLPESMADHLVGPSKLDSLGNLWQAGSISHDESSVVEVIVKRTFNDSTIVFYEGDYDGKYSGEYSNLPPIYLHSTDLVSGM